MSHIYLKHLLAVAVVIFAAGAVFAQSFSDPMQFYVTYDNHKGKRHLTEDWGFAMYVEGAHLPVAFDAGADAKILTNNMKKLDLDPDRTGSLVISHVHSDHIGGIDALLIKGLKVYLPTGAPASLIKKIKSKGAEPIIASEPTKIYTGVMTTGTVSYGETPEQGLLVETKEGWVLLTGCAHPGPAAMMEAAKKAVGQYPKTLIGGMHLKDTSEEKIVELAKKLKDMGVVRVGPGHCSGELARQIFRAVFEHGYLGVDVGFRYLIN